jgi:hypothetical protein
MNYQTVFEITDKGYQWWFPALGVIGALISIGLRSAPFVPHSTKRILTLTLWFSSVWAGGIFLLTYSQFYLLRKSYRAHEYQVVEGLIEKFEPMPYEGHQNESFTVKGTRFEYSDFAVRPGFSQTSSHGGPIRQGLNVRVCHRGNIILKLDIAK